MWHNKYVGIPYKDNGRDTSGIDCWGLARYVYNKEFNITLPSFAEDYEGDDRARIADLIAQYREGWEQVTSDFKSGDLILFRVLGSESHIGIVTDYPYFLHAREGRDSSIERVDSTSWKHRLVGVFRYKEATKNNLVAVPNPLKTNRITDIIPAGATLRQVHEQLLSQHGVPELKDNTKTVIIVNGIVFPEEKWDYAVKESDTIEYRAVPKGSSITRLLLVVAVAWFAWEVLPGLLTEAGAGAAGGMDIAGSTFFAKGSFSLAMAQMGVMTAGMALINKLVPIRPPTINTPDQGRSMSMINGASNAAIQYGTIPVVLGRVRITPPVGAVNYIEPLTTNSYLRMLLVWGFGPVQIEDVRVGTNFLTDYELTDQATIYGYGNETADQIAAFNNIYGTDVQQVFKNIKLVGSDGGSPWQEMAFTQSSTQLKVHIHFPQGLRRLNNKDGSVASAPFIAEIQYDTVGSNTWGHTLYDFPANSKVLPDSTVTTYATAVDGDGYEYQYKSTSTTYYQWHTAYMIRGSGISWVKGTPSETLTGEPSDALKQAIAGVLNTSTTGMTRLAPLPLGAVPLFYVCVYNGAIVQATKVTDYAHTATISYTGLSVSISAGTVTATGTPNYVYLGDSGQEFVNYKDAFTYTVSITPPAAGVYKVRIRRVNSGASDVYGGDWIMYHDAYIYAASAYANNAPVTDIPDTGAILARSAYRIKANDQLNGAIEGINALVTSICWDWDITSGTWIKRGTNNPASLFRYILQHPANAQRISDSDVSSKIDLAQLQYWHAYCISKGFTFNTALSNVRSILDILRDVCAAGRASPTLIDGKWTVIIDEPKTQVVQHFSTHNSWGFEAAKPLIKIPDAFKVTFYNEAANYVQDEIYIYNTGKNSSNAKVFESIEFPGITNAQAVSKHARWHLAQLKLRPETYKLSTDLEYLVCNRGDLVRVQHDVPMWGIGTARIKNRASNGLSVDIDNDFYMDAGVAYTIRIRTASGASVTRNLVPVSETGYYNTITLASSVSTIEGAPDNLILFGLLNSESQQCLVQSIEPTVNGNATLTLVDYNEAMYQIDSSPDYPIPNFSANITRFPDTFIPTVSHTPTITQIISNEQALELISPGVFRVRIKVSYTGNTYANGVKVALDPAINRVQLQWKFSSSSQWSDSSMSDVTSDSCYATDVNEGASYDLRLRFVRFDGITGPWVTATNHIVIGKSTPPSAVVGLGTSISGAQLKLYWLDNPEIDVILYEVRTSDVGWGVDTNYVFKGASNNILVSPPTSGSSTTWYVRAIDASNNYSLTSSPISYGTSTPANVTTINGVFSTTSLTEATMELNWNSVTATFGTAYYEISYNGIVKLSNSTSIILPADWLGDRSFTVKVVDLNGNKSTGTSKTITKLAPNPVTNTRAQVIDNNVLLYWTYGAKTTLPVSHVMVKRSTQGDGATWNTATVVGSKSGEFTSLSELSAGNYIYWLAAVDTDNRESTPVQVSAIVSQPPDFKFNAEYTSTFTGTKNNATTYAGELFLPVDTSETWQSHFTSRSWTTPQAQVTAGYPIFVQPGISGSGYYEEIFDYGTVLGSSQITATVVGAIVSGTVNVTTDISISADNVTWINYAGISTVFARSFRYIKVKVTVATTSLGNVYKVSSLKVRLDAKQKTESDSVMANSTDTNGTTVNFINEFVDVQSITLSPSGTTAINAVYDFKDAIITGTYTLTSNVATINAAAHGLSAGQEVRLYFTSGTAPSGLYFIQSVVNANSYTVNIVNPNTSGSVSTYPNSMKVYLFDNSGNRVSATTSYIVRGY